MRLTHFFAILKARTMEFVRDRESFIWNLVFPIIMVIGFSIVLPGSGNTVFKVGILGQTDSRSSFAEIQQVEVVNYERSDASLKEAQNKLRKHELDLIIDYQNRQYWVNRLSPKSLMVERLFKNEMAADQSARPFSTREVSGKAVRYIDWLLPGVIGMNMMFSCLFGVGYVIVRYRKNGVLKRLKATPVTAFTFISAQMVSRFFIVLGTAIVAFLGLNLFLGFHMEGSYLVLLLHTAIAVLCLISIGLAFATRLKSEELVNGLLNLLTFPMIILSGVFFSLEGSPGIIQAVAQIFPLTHFIDGARSVMLDGAGFEAIWPQTAALAGIGVVMTGLSAFLFKWE